MEKTANFLLNVARNWLGRKESDGSFKEILDTYNAHKPLARGYAMKYTDEWCDAFVSAVAIKAGMTDLIGTEVGCEKHVDIFKEKGIWIEDGAIIPVPGDIIVYNWGDNTQPNDGRSDHVGYVESVSDGKITTIEGNRGSAVARRVIPVGWGYIRGFARPKYEVEVVPKPQSPVAPKKSIEEIAREVINGVWGNGEERRKALTLAKYNPNEVQAKVNELMAKKTPTAPKPTSKKSLDEVARDVLRGVYGNGQTRRNRLTKEGYNPDEVQKKVNEIYKRK